METLLPQLQITLPKIENMDSGKKRRNSSPLEGEVGWGGATLDVKVQDKKPTQGMPRPPSPNPSPNPSREGRGTPPLPLQPISLFSHKPKQVWLEIGFGGGEHLAAQAKQHPDIGFIGCEPFVNGVASLLDHIDRLYSLSPLGGERVRVRGEPDAENPTLNLERIKQINIRIFPDDARRLIDALPDASIDRCFVLFADPWPKKKHATRRFIGPNNIPALARILKKGAELRLATDDPKLKIWTKEHMDAAKDFARLYDTATQPKDWIETRYEQKAIKAGRKPVYRGYEKK